MNFHERWDRVDFAPTLAARQVRLPLAPSLERRRMQVNLGLLLLDGVALTLAFCLADFLYHGSIGTPRTMLVLQLLLPIYWTAGLVLGAYSKQALVSGVARWVRAVTALGASAAMVTFVTFMLKNSSWISRGTILIGLALAGVLLVAGRFLAGPMIRKFLGPTGINILVIDDGGDPVRVPHAYHVDSREHGLDPDLNSPYLLDRLGLYMMNMDRVLVSCPRHRRHAWAMVFRSGHIQGEIVDRDVLELGVIGASRGHRFGSLVVSAGVLGLRSRVLKRLFDAVLVSLAIIPLAPVYVLTALAIVLEDGGPVFFVQRRVGRGNTFFPLYKFRSMRVDHGDQAGNVSTMREDFRVTRVGRIIRKFSIDELPQLLNVLIGHMSLARSDLLPESEAGTHRLVHGKVDRTVGRACGHGNRGCLRGARHQAVVCGADAARACPGPGGTGRLAGVRPDAEAHPGPIGLTSPGDWLSRGLRNKTEPR